MTNSTEERLVQYAERASLRDLVSMASFANVTPSTALGWVCGSPAPKGETLLRLQYFLQLEGLAPSELDSMPLPAYQLGKDIAYGVIDVNTAMHELGYSDANGLYRLLRGAELSAARLEMLEQLLTRHEEEAEEAFTRHRRLYDERSENAMHDASGEQPSASTSASSSSASDFYATHVAGAILTTGALVKSLLGSSDKDGMIVVRDLVGSAMIYDLATALIEITD